MKSNDQIIEEFEKFCQIDRQLSESTVKCHSLQIKRFLKSIKKNPLNVSCNEIRDYLIHYKNMSPYTYANVLKSLKVFFREYMNMPVVVHSFRFPKKSYNNKQIPSKEDLHKFYNSLPTIRDKAIFLIYATSGLRRNELLSLKVENVNFSDRMIIPSKRYSSNTKHTWITFYNEETAKKLEYYISTKGDLNQEEQLFPFNESYIRKAFKKATVKSNVRITPQVLREWFCSEMGRLGVPDRYIDAFCGRVPRSILARHYTDYSPERLKEIYDKARLKV